MIYRGQVRNGQIVLDANPPLPEGAMVEVSVCETCEKAVGDKELDSLFRIGELAVETGISDLAAHADHYLYGHPKVDHGQ